MKSTVSKLGLVAAITITGALVQSRSNAGLVTLVDDNSSASFNTATQAGQFSWLVNGVEQLNKQWFWYRVGGGAEASIDTLPISFESATDTTFDGNNDTLLTRYAGNGFTLQVRYGLDGAVGGAASDLSEQILVTNTGTSALDFHFFEYADFNLAGSAAGDSAVFTNANTVDQSKGLFRLVETVVTPASSHREIGLVPTTLDKLNDGVGTTLSDTAIGTVVGPGDVAWAYQWDVSIPIGGTFQISKDKNLTSTVPEPTSLPVLGGMLALLGAARRRR